MQYNMELQILVKPLVQNMQVEHGIIATCKALSTKHESIGMQLVSFSVLNIQAVSWNYQYL